MGKRIYSEADSRIAKRVDELLNEKGRKIYCYDCDTTEKADQRGFDSMAEFFEAFPAAEIGSVTVCGKEVRVYC